MSEARALLEVENLSVTFATPRGPVPAVVSASFKVVAGEVLGLVGESGSGKTVTLKALLRLLRPSVRIGGKLLWQGEDILAMRPERLRALRGREIAMIFQEPMTALNPVLTIGVQIDEMLVAHTELDRAGRRRRAIELLDQVGIPAAATRLTQYPHEFSGGMRQRAMIATALAAKPRLLLADEPTTALDVTIQDQILTLLGNLTSELGMSMILVTHDLGVVAQTCDRVCVMYAGEVVEAGTVTEVFEHPRHGYTSSLLAAIASGVAPRALLDAIPGQPSPPGFLREGCAFAPRCRYVEDACRLGRRQLRDVAQDHASACLAEGRIPRRVEVS
jgi:oligopeptide/dipeptide ABC transporter ATP-binding protein